MRYLKSALLVFTACAAWAVIAVAMAFYGWWLEPIAAENDSEAFFRAAVARIKTQNPGNTAFVLLDGGQIVGKYYGPPERGINGDTLFPTASFSKWITALAVMTLADSGRIDLDAPIETYLERWHLPPSAFDNRQVTARRLLSHTAGLTDGLGFGDYQPTEQVPDIVESLEKPRASGERNAVIAVGIEPGTAFNYSGGGYLVLELLIEEVTALPFPDYVRKTVLEPLGMERSTWDYIGDLSNASQSFERDGAVAPQYRYASRAATGFASSALDLTRLVRGMIAPPTTLPLESRTLESMREPHGFVFGSGVWGLGTILYTRTANGVFVYGHDGGNDPAINASVRINPESGDGFIMLVNGHPSLATALGAEWVLWQTGYPDFLVTEETLKSAIWPVLIGWFALLGLPGLILLQRRKYLRPER